MATRSIFGEHSATLVGTNFLVDPSSQTSGVTPNGIATGWKFDDDTGIIRGFVHFSPTGQTQFLPDSTRAQFVAENGLVRGLVCTGGECHAFHWSPSEPVLAEHPGFQPGWMNNGGTMVGRYQPATGVSRLATVDTGGAIAPLPNINPGPGLSVVPMWLCIRTRTVSTLAAEAEFHWSARDGTTALTVGGSAAIPNDVNALGVVVGSFDVDHKPFIWQKDVGGVRLPFAAGGRLEAIGDGGHLFRSVFDRDQPDGIAISVFAPDPAASAPGG